MSSKVDLFEEVYEKNGGTDLFEEVYSQEEVSKPSKVASLARAAGKGLLSAALDAARLSPVVGAPPPSLSLLEESYKEKIGEPQEGFAERFTERVAKNLPWLLGGAGGVAGKAVRAVASSTLGQLGEESGLGETGQFLLESIALGAPGFRKKIVPKSSQKEAIEMLRRLGLKEKEIAPALTSPKVAERLKYLTKRTGLTQKRIRRTQEAMGRVYDQLGKEGKETAILSSQESENLRNSLNNIIEDLPEEITKNARAKIEKTFRKPIKAKDLMDLTWKLNQEIFSGKSQNPKKALNALKSDIGKSLIKIDPKLGKDFIELQSTYSNFVNGVRKNLKPSSFTELLKYGKMGTLVTGILSFNPSILKGIVGTEAARYAFAEILLNPRFKNLTNQMLKALNNNKPVLAKKISEEMKRELKDMGYDLKKEKEEG